MHLHYRPFTGNDATAARVAHGTLTHHRMVAQHAVEFRAKTFNSASALLVEEMGAELGDKVT
tara:strand:- start:61 stop:246 length:186 start_codon:yes stop_codon:yes gene_type:complete